MENRHANIIHLHVTTPMHQTVTHMELTVCWGLFWFFINSNKQALQPAPLIVRKAEAQDSDDIRGQILG